MELFVDFEELETTPSNITIKKYDKEYDKTTTEFYKQLREKKLNTITHDTFEFNPDMAFKFKYMWDPYTGERLGEDPYGPLYFNPDDLIHFFYRKRLSLLWTDPKDEVGGYYQGYYGDALGNGEDIHIMGRGDYPELYLFRLPVDNCYLYPNSDLSIITMGPKLTDDEIKEIEYLAETYHNNNYWNIFHKNRPSLSKIKNLYDIAINKTPNIKDIEKFTEEEINKLWIEENKHAVELLKKL
jgi:hypothetical protein